MANSRPVRDCLKKLRWIASEEWDPRLTSDLTETGGKGVKMEGWKNRGREGGGERQIERETDR